MAGKPIRCDVQVHELDEDGDTVLFDKQGSRLLVLNAVGAGVWHLCDGTRTVDDIVDEILETLPADRAQVRTDIERFLRELESSGLVTLG